MNSSLEIVMTKMKDRIMVFGVALFILNFK